MYYSLISIIIGAIWYLIFFIGLFGNSSLTVINEIVLFLIAVNGSIFLIGGFIIKILDKIKNNKFTENILSEE